jgi:hypothetical protein
MNNYYVEITDQKEGRRKRLIVMAETKPLCNEYIKKNWEGHPIKVRLIKKINGSTRGVISEEEYW